MNEIIRTELLPGTSLSGGKYIIEKKIGSGGFGITYIAKHSTLEKRYAIKEFFLSGYNVRNNVTNHISLQGIETQDFEKFRLRFIEEARTLAALNNEAVVKVIDIFDENGTSYMVMPFVEGVTLQSMVEKNGPMDYEMAVNYIVQVCEALSYIHSKNILHRDVTPDNIIITPSQKIVLIDFGSARKFVDNKTQRHTTIVKKGYAPLEQYSASSRKGAYTDLYSLGAVFYYILTGERPMDATERTLEKMKEPIEINPKVPEQINAVIMKAMEMDSANRYQTATELTDDIFSGKFPKKSKAPRKAVNANIKKEPESHHQKRDIQEEKHEHADSIVEEDFKQPQSTDNQAQSRIKKGILLKIAAVLMAVIAILLIVLVVRNRVNKAIDTVDEGETMVIQESTPAISATYGVALDSLQKTSSEALIHMIEEDTHNPAVLYAMAYKAYSGVFNDQFKGFWNEVLLPEGDVDLYLAYNKGVSSKRFAFVCAARAYTVILDNNDEDPYNLDLKERLMTLLVSLKNNSDGNMIYGTLD